MESKGERWRRLSSSSRYGALSGRKPFSKHRSYLGFKPSQVALVVKNPPASAGDARDAGLIPGWGRSPEEGNGNPLQYSCLDRKSHRQKNLVGYSPWDCRESDMTERLSTTTTSLVVNIGWHLHYSSPTLYVLGNEEKTELQRDSGRCEIKLIIIGGFIHSWHSVSGYFQIQKNIWIDLSK